MSIGAILVLDEDYKYQYSTSRYSPLEYIITENGCWEITNHYIDPDGYVRIHRYGHRILSHRYAYNLLVQEIPINLCVLHKCDVRHCINPDHLFLGTYKDNSIDMVRKGRHANKKLNVSDVLQIRLLYTPYKYSYNKLGKLFGVSASTIQDLIEKKTWSHI